MCSTITTTLVIKKNTCENGQYIFPSLYDHFYCLAESVVATYWKCSFEKEKLREEGKLH